MKTNFYEKFVELKRYTDRVGSVYGTEDFSVYLYSMIKMMRPKTVVELGTGLGSAMLWSGLALEENQEGVIYTVDDGSEWDRLKAVKNTIGDDFHEDYSEFVLQLIQKYGLEKQVSFLNEKINIVNVDNIDILFSDFAHGVFDVTKLLVDYIPKMNDYSKIYIDSASTHYPSYMALGQIIDMLNRGKLPRVFHEVYEHNNANGLQQNYDLEKLKYKIENTEFKIEHMVENKDRNQNSTCCITLTPIDIFPYPRKNIRSL